VRVTIEGECRADEPSYLSLEYGDRNLCRVRHDDPRVTVEWLPDQRDWRDGDVVRDGARVWVRHPDGKGGHIWRTTSGKVTLSDHVPTAWVNSAGATVLRYQADEDE
jgi:hypothetical protein